MTGRFSILTKGLALIIVPVLVQLLIMGVLILRQQYRYQAEYWVIHTKEVIAESESMFRVLVEAESGVQGYVATGEKRLDALWRRSAEEAPKLCAGLQALVHDNPPQLERIIRVGQRVEQVLGQLRTINDLATAGDSAQATTQLRAFAAEDSIGAIRGEMDAFIKREEALDRQRGSTLDKIQSQQIWITVGGTAILLLTGISAAVVFSRGIVRRLAVLHDNVRRMAAGETLEPSVGGRDEISALDASFHQMATAAADAAAKEKTYQQSLERRGAELQATNDELKQKSDENEMFVYSVSHDLRSPLVNLQGFSKELQVSVNDLKELFHEPSVPEYARRRGDDIIEHGIGEPIHFIQTAVMRLGAIIDALLRLSRAGRVEYQRQTVDPGPIIGRIIDAMRSTSAQKGASVSVTSPLPPVVADPTALEQIFANLIGNALNYLDKKRPGVIEVSAAPDEKQPDWVNYRVKDNGLGIPEAYQAKIFNIFQRVHGNVAPGEGIGLALVRRMVERHGGRIWVETQENVGSTFIVSLPLPADAPP